VKQVLQSLRNGVTDVADVPCPIPGRRQVLVRSSRTLLSAGTERMLVSFGRAGMIEKARQQPERVRQVVDKMRTDGVLPTIDAVTSKLEQPLPLGYCNVGTIVEAGADIEPLKLGSRVVSNGKHAEFVAVGRNLCARIPDTVSDDEAAFTVLGAIALQGVRIAKPTLGESVVVIGLGLIGLMAVQILTANGCRVIGLDFDAEKLALAREFGAETHDLSGSGNPLAAVDAFTRERGADAVLITASTKSNEPVQQAARMSRKRGRIVLVGVTGLTLSRADFYEKELTFQVSCSYGPGRYDPNYEEAGYDYPIGFVRWTEQRNFEAVLDLLASGKINVQPLISHRFPISEAADAYGLIADDSPSLGILLEYPQEGIARTIDGHEDPAQTKPSRTVALSPLPSAAKGARIAFIGAGNYARSVLMPAFKATEATLVSVASSGGVSGLHAARKFGFSETTTDAAALIADSRANAVVIATRHDSHAQLTCEALAARKHVFVEKPLAMTHDQLKQIVAAQAAAPDRLLMVGFNRRFAPHVTRIKSLLSGRACPKAFVMTVNAGAIPSDHWSQDPTSGGGRIVGEVCHFIDLIRFLAGASIELHTIHRMKSSTGDTITISLSFADGSIGTIHYFANGSKALPKERLEVFAEGGVLQLDNFRKLKGFGWPGFRSQRLLRQDKGQRAAAAAFIDAITYGRMPPIPFEELTEVAAITIDLAGTTICHT